MNCKTFFNELFGDIPEKTFINVWTLPKKHSQFFTSADAAAAYVEKIKKDKIEIYFGCGIRNKRFGAGKRGIKNTVCGIPGYWMDIDIATKIKKGCPPTIEDAMALIEGYGWDPTLVVHSGHGIHAWWLFKELWIFSNAKDRDKAELLNKRLQATIQKRAEEKGWKLDSTHDVTRVLRPIGTINYKDIPIDVKLHQNSGGRFSDPEDVDTFLISTDQLSKSATSTVDEEIKSAKNFMLDPMAEPPPDRLDELCELDPKFKQSWMNKRKDLPST